MTTTLLQVSDAKNSACHELFNIKNPDYVSDPYPYYALVRENFPIYKTPYGVYVVTRHADIISLLANKKITKKYWEPIEKIYGPQCYQESGFKLIASWLTNLNSIEHTQLRKLLTTALSNKALSNLHDLAAKLTNQLIDSFYEQGKIDLMKAFAFKLPALMICHLLAIPEEDFDFVFEHVKLPNILLDPVYHARSTLDKANEGVDILVEYFTNLCAQRRQNLGNDLISLLLQAKQQEQIAVTDAALISNIFFLFGAGYETTMNLIGNVIYTLFAHPGELAKLQENNNKLSGAIEEVLRYQSPVQVASPSHTIEAIELCGYVIPKDEIVIPILASANRDQRQYANPDTFDIDRQPSKLLSFGSGPHLCIGSHLARLEVKVAIECLFKRIPNLSIENINAPKWKPHVGLRGLSELIAHW